MAVRATLDQLYTSIYDEFMLGTFEEFKGGCLEAFKEVDTKQKNFIVDDISGLGMWESANELESGNAEDPVLGYPKTYTIGKFTKVFQVSFEALDDDEYALLKKQSDAMEMGRGGRAKLSYDLAQIMIGGFSTACPDGQYLFSNSHPKNREETGTTYDNLLSGAFSHDALEDAETQIAANLKDMKGLPIHITQDPIVLHPTALRGQIERVLNERAIERPGTTSRDINQFTVRRGRFQYKPVECVWLDAANGGSDTAWFIVFPWLGYFKLVWRQKPQFTSWVDYDIDAYNFKGRMRYACGADNWRGAFGSTGL